MHPRSTEWSRWPPPIVMLSCSRFSSSPRTPTSVTVLFFRHHHRNLDIPFLPASFISRLFNLLLLNTSSCKIPPPPPPLLPCSCLCFYSFPLSPPPFLFSPPSFKNLFLFSFRTHIASPLFFSLLHPSRIHPSPYVPCPPPHAPHNHGGACRVLP